MRILRIIARLNVGGPARHVVIADAGLRARGHETLLAFGSVGRGEASFDRLVEEGQLPAVRLGHLNPRLRPFQDAAAFVEVLRLIRAFRPDVVHTHTAKAGALGRVAVRLLNGTSRRRIHVVHTFHGHVFEGYFGAAMTAAVRAAESTLARATDRILVVSERQREDIVERFHVAPREKVRVVPLGLDLEPFRGLAPEPSRAARGAFGIPDGCFVLGYVGRLVPIKNLGFLIEAFARFREQHRQTILLLAGDGTDRENLQRQVAELRLVPHVRFLGWRSDLVTFYGALDAAVLTSRNEGTPVALIEAMAAARAVVSTEAGGVPDVVNDGRTGLLSVPGDLDAFVHTLRRLADSEPLRRQLGLAAREDVCRRYAAERLVNDLERVYKELRS